MVANGEINQSASDTATLLNGGIRRVRPLKPIKLRNTSSLQITLDILHNKSNPHIPAQCQDYTACVGALMRQTKEFMSHVHGRPISQLLEEAHQFMEQFYSSINSLHSEDHQARIREMEAEVAATGTYQLTEAELTYGAKMAWRNAARCIGRIQWQKLKLFNAQHCTTAKEMFDAICNHIRYTTNGGNLRSAITVFAPRAPGRIDFRLWNPQLLSYAGYVDTSINDNVTSGERKCPIVGDPQNVEFTKVCQKLGWKAPGTKWDILPIVISVPGQDPEVFPIPEELVLRIPLMHPRFDWFEKLKLQWYALPAVSNMMYDVGGIEYPACPFSGWYMDTEVAVRDLADPHRYNILPTVAKNMGLDTSTNMSLWKDQAVVEVNIAVLYSYQKANVTIMDHHSAAESFMKHLENENRLRGGCPADWVWIVPPISGSLTPVYYQEMINYELKPAYLYQEPAWKTHIWQSVKQTGPVRKLKFKEAIIGVLFMSTLFSKILSKRIKATILYATETGRSEMFSKRLSLILSNAFNVSIKCMDVFDIRQLESESLLLIVASTFGNGDPPENGESLTKQFQALRSEPKSKHRFTGKFAVFGLGSTAYPNFCAYGKTMDLILAELGGVRIHKVGTGDELSGQEQSFNEWATGVFDSACEVFGCFASSYDLQEVMRRAIMDGPTWSKDNVKLQEYVQTGDELKKAQPKAKRIEQALTNLSNHKKIMCYKVIEREFLHGRGQEPNMPQTIRVMLKANLKDHQQDDKRPPEEYYKPGDHLAVYPQNEAPLVSGIIERVTENLGRELDVDADWPYLVKVSSGEVVRDANNNAEKQWTLHDKLPAPISLREALSRYLDITTPPTQQFLKMLADTADDEIDKEKLMQLVNDSNKYEHWKNLHVPNLLEVMEEFSSVKPSLELLFTQLPLLQPRYYSISSSPLCSVNSNSLQVDLTIAVVQYTTSTGAIHNGVCSNFMAHVAIGQSVYGFLRNAPNFHLPKEPNVPIMLIGPGTGIAPFRAFWEHRIKQRELNPEIGLNFGKMKLYFGCRYPAMQLYRREIEEMILEDVITEYYVAYSRKPGKPKKYVQDKLRLMSKPIYRTLMEQNGHIYVCGDVAMAEEVNKTIKAILAENEVQDVESAINLLKEKERYHEDIFGVTKRTAAITDGATGEHVVTMNGNGNLNHKNTTLLSKSMLTFSRDRKVDLRFWKRWLVNG